MVIEDFNYYGIFSVINQKGEFIPSLVLKSNLALRCCLTVALISAFLTSKLIPVAITGQMNDISQT